MSKRLLKSTIKKDSSQYIEPVIYISTEAPKQTPDIVSEIISMRGIVKFSIINWSSKIIYNYERWGKIEKSFTEADTLNILTSIKKSLNKIGKKSIDHLILRSDDMNVIIFSSQQIIIFLHCDKKAALPILTIKVKRVIQNLSSII
ncbi:MAG: hypothetical protein JXA54_01885 [Candidatus Heimdallarchaeota archaeon]|nr:hypothetical protein [Candidatus Heimdallarchaeota archaeon]